MDTALFQVDCGPSLSARKGNERREIQRGICNGQGSYHFRTCPLLTVREGRKCSPLSGDIVYLSKIGFYYKD